MKTKKIYNPPITEMVEVEFEGGFMDDGVSIKGHEVGNTGDYTDIGWDGDNTFNN